MAHVTVAKAEQHEDVIEGSRFVGFVWPATSPEEALALLESVRRAHPEATHHCWAYRINEVQRFSDDGEPGGTAGRPMLEVILKRQLNMVAAVVVRYYGGKKLGAGGLVRAYSGAVSKALDRAGVREVVDMATLQVGAPFSLVDAVLRTVEEMISLHPDAARGEAEFDALGLKLTLRIPQHQLQQAEERLTEVTHGAARLARLDS